MENPAPAARPIHDLIARRWSPRAFDSRVVSRDVLFTLFEAARWSPSCFNEQPWSYIVGLKGEAGYHARLAACLSPGNAWAEAAPVLMLSVAKLAFDKTGKPNRHAWHDVGAASLAMSLQATAMGLFAHQMAGFDAAKARADLGIPDTHDPVAMIALGYPGDPAALPDKLREREHEPRTRAPVESFVRLGRGA